MVAQRSTMGVAEYLATEATGQVKHEYVDGMVRAMAGGTIAHDRIANNIRSALVVHLGAGPCMPLGPDVRVRVSPTIYYYPDALVTSDEDLDPEAVEVTTPRLIVEVLLRGTEADDRGEKFASYQSLGSVEEYLLVGSLRRGAECYRRAEHGLWTYRRYSPREEVTLETIGLTVALETLYVGTRVPG